MEKNVWFVIGKLYIWYIKKIKFANSLIELVNFIFLFF